MGEHPAKQEIAAWSLVRLQSRGYAIRGMEVSEKLPQEHGDAPCTIADCAYGSTFFIATGFHGLHVIRPNLKPSPGGNPLAERQFVHTFRWTAQNKLCHIRLWVSNRTSTTGTVCNKINEIVVILFQLY